MLQKEDQKRVELVEELRKEIDRLDQVILREIEFRRHPERDISNPFRPSEYHAEREQIARRKRSNKLAELRELQLESRRVAPPATNVIWLGTDEARRNLIRGLAPRFVRHVFDDDLESTLDFCFPISGDDVVLADSSDRRLCWLVQQSSLLFLVKRLIDQKYLPNITDRELAAFVHGRFWRQKVGQRFNFDSLNTYAQRMGSRPTHSAEIKRIIDGI